MIGGKRREPPAAATGEDEEKLAAAEEEGPKTSADGLVEAKAPVDGVAGAPA